MPGLSALPPILHAEPLPLDLLNTRLYLNDTWIDLLDHKGNRTEWLTAEAERLDIALAEVTAGSGAVAQALKQVRADAERAIEPARHSRRPPARALAGLNAALKAAPATPQAHWNDNGVVVSTRRHGPLALRLAAGFAEATIDLLADRNISKVRRCEAPACEILFLARNPRRRWCTPDICGNRARVARYYLRHKADRPATR